MKTIRIKKQKLKQVKQGCSEGNEAAYPLHAVINAIQDGIRVMDSDLIIRVQNETARQISKGRKEIGLPCYQVHYGRQEPCDNCHCLEAMKTGKLIKKKEFFQNDDDKKHVFEVCAQPILDEKGRPIGVLESFHDITEDQKREEALQRSETRYGIMVENINDALYLHDFSGLIMDVNNQACRMTGYSREELIGKRISFLMDMETIAKLPGRMEQLKKTGKGLFESVKRHINGAFIPIEVSVKVISGEGNGLLQSIVRDISERKTAETLMKLTEKRYEMVTAVSGIGAWEYNHDIKTDWYSPTYFTMLGYDESEFLLPEGKGHLNAWHMLIHPEDKDQAQRCLEEYLEGGFQGFYESTFRMKRKEGTWAWIRSRGQNLRDEHGTPMKITLGTHVDITQNRQIQHELEEKNLDLAQAKEEAEASNKAKTQFLANMSHELRTPLNGLMGMLQLLQSTNPSEEQEEYIKIALGSSQSLTRVVEDILNYTNLDKRAQKIIEEPFQLEGLLQEVLGLHKSAAIHKGLFINVYRDNSLPGQVMGDRFKLKQILGNLVGNAVKFTESGAVQLSVKLTDEEVGDGRMKICFQVKDTGVGIPPEKMDYIFQRFSQADESHTRAYGGLGLGLAVAREQAAILGGILTAQSTPGQGSVFTLICDVGVGQEQKPGTDPLEAGVVYYSQTEFSGVQVLVVDDDYASRLMAQLQLEKMGCDVELATDGQTAVEKVAAKVYHLIFMDCQMPVMEGYEATRIIREMEKKNGRRTPIVAMTAKVLPGDREKCLEVGMDGFLEKPIELEQLKAEVRIYCSDRINSL